MAAAWVGDLARLMAGAPRPDGQGGWTIPAERRVQHIAEQRARVQAEEGARLAATIEQEVRRALIELEERVAAEPDWVERAWRMHQAGQSMRAVAAALVDETTYRSSEGLRNRLRQEFAARGLQARDRLTATSVALTTHGMYAGNDRDKKAARRRQVRAERATYCTGSNPRGKPCKRRVAEGAQHCWWHDPANADAVAQRAEVMRARRARAGNTQRGGPNGSRHHGVGHDDERQAASLAWAGGGAARAAA